MLFVDFLALLCWFGTVYAFTVPVWHLIFDKDLENKKFALRVLGLLVVGWFFIRFSEKWILDKILQHNTAPAVGRWSCINSSNVLTNIEFHDPYPSFPSGHMLLGAGTGLFLLRYYNSLNTKILVVLGICTSAFIKMYMNMHSIWDIGITIILVVGLYYVIIKSISYLNNLNRMNEKKKLIIDKVSENDVEKIIKTILFFISISAFLYLFLIVCSIILPLI